MNDNEEKAVAEAKEIIDKENKSDTGPPDAVVNAANKRCNCDCNESSRTKK